ncbi:hypothetical protein TKK_0014824 [Trichogramma kaykai]
MFLCSVSAQSLYDLKYAMPEHNLACWPSPLSAKAVPINLYFSSRKRMDHWVAYDSNKFNPSILDFDPQRRTAILIHGFLGSGQDFIFRQMEDYLLQWRDMNVIVVGWEQGCNNFAFYQQAAVNTEYAAIEIRNVLTQLMKYWMDRGVDPNQWGYTHIIGHSLGAHVAGQVGKMMQRYNNFHINRITALDPAEPCFETQEPLRLSRRDALLVDVIHSDGARTKNQAFGLLNPIGDVDFYLNGGTLQPECKVGNLMYRRRKREMMNYPNVLIHLLDKGVCRHFRSVVLFVESLKRALDGRCNLWSHPWQYSSNADQARAIFRTPCNENNCVEVGINAERYKYQPQSSTFYVRTDLRRPGCAF